MVLHHSPSTAVMATIAANSSLLVLPAAGGCRKRRNSHRLLSGITEDGEEGSDEDEGIRPEKNRKTHDDRWPDLEAYPKVFDEDQQLRETLRNPETVRSIHMTKLLGSGGFGSVYLATIGERKVAVKRLHASTKNDRARLESFKAELYVMRLNHPNIVRTLATTELEKPEDAMVVMEYAGEKDLLQVLNDPDEEVDVVRRLRYCRDLADALAYIHSNCIVHLDLKPANVLIAIDDSCKLADFGCCQIVEGETGMVSPTERSSRTGTMVYRAPELHVGKPPSTRADIYSLGITMWQLLSREQPFQGEHFQAVVFRVVSCQLRPTSPPHVNLEDPLERLYCDLYQECWQQSPTCRPHAADLTDVFSIWMHNI